MGAVLDGYTRDTPQVLAQNFPVFARGRWAQDSSIRTNVVDFRCTIEIGQVTIHDGDIVFGDMDGVLIIPKEVEKECIEKAFEKAAGEKKVRSAIEGGMSGCRDPESDNPIRDHGSLLVLLSVIVFHHFQ